MESDKGTEGRLLPEAAARAMAASYCSAVEGVASRWGISEDEALDVVHDVLVHLLEVLARFPGRLRIENWPAYLATAAGRRWQRSRGDHGREMLFNELAPSERREIHEEIPGPQASPSEAAAENELERIAWAALDQLPFHHKGVIEMRLSGAPFEEIGQELAITSACARRRYCDGIRVLRTRFGIASRKTA
jgi:RNA polymerase sigma factor (sigma-70 family)